MNTLLIFALLAVAVTFSHGFVITPRSTVKTTNAVVSRSPLFMSDEAPEEQKVTMADADIEQKQMFDMNRRVRLGRSRDQDGKSNIWSIEPTMQVQEEDQTSLVKKNLFIGGAVIGVAIACLPLFNAFNSLFPDPSDF